MSISVLQSYRLKELTEPKVYLCGEDEILQNTLGVLLALPERQLPSHAHFQCSIERVKLSLRSKNVFLYIFTGKKKHVEGSRTHVYLHRRHTFICKLIYIFIYILYVCTYIALCLNNNNYYNCKVGTTFFLSKTVCHSCCGAPYRHTRPIYIISFP